MRDRVCKLSSRNRSGSCNNIIRGSSAVEQLTVNQLVAGSNPVPGAKNFATEVDLVPRPGLSFFVKHP